jgi:hypothetical protein
MGISTKLMAQDPEGSRGVTELGRHLFAWAVFDEISPERLVLPLPGKGGLKEEALALRYAFRCAYAHVVTLLHGRKLVKRKCKETQNSLKTADNGLKARPFAHL